MNSDVHIMTTDFSDGPEIQKVTQGYKSSKKMIFIIATAGFLFLLSISTIIIFRSKSITPELKKKISVTPGASNSTSFPPTAKDRAGSYNSQVNSGNQSENGGITADQKINGVIPSIRPVIFTQVDKFIPLNQIGSNVQETTNGSNSVSNISTGGNSGPDRSLQERIDNPGAVSPTLVTGNGNNQAGDIAPSGNPSPTGSNWNSLINTSYQYSLRYPNSWIAEETVINNNSQSTKFHLSSDASTVVAFFYISQILNSNQPFTQSDLSMLQADYQTKIYINPSGIAYSYQCVPVLDEAIIQTCSQIENTIVFGS